MLMVFNLDWKRFSIAPQMAEANAFMQEMALSLDISERIIFNCASMGAGEWILKKREGQEDIPSDTLNYVRWHHHKVVEAVRSDAQYRINFETREMLQSLRRAGHGLVAVFTGATNVLEDILRGARCRDIFADNVVGYDRLHDSRRTDLTGVGLYREACRRAGTEPAKTVIVSDDPDGVVDAKPILPQATVGYVASAESDPEKDAHIKALEGVSPDYTLIGGASVACLPFLFEARAEHRATQVTTREFLNQMLRETAAGGPPPALH